MYVCRNGNRRCVIYRTSPIDLETGKTALLMRWDTIERHIFQWRAGCLYGWVMKCRKVKGRITMMQILLPGSRNVCESPAEAIRTPRMRNPGWWPFIQNIPSFPFCALTEDISAGRASIKLTKHCLCRLFMPVDGAAVRWDSLFKD